MPRNPECSAAAIKWLAANPAAAAAYTNLSREQRARAGQALGLVKYWRGLNGREKWELFFMQAWEPSQLVENEKGNPNLLSVTLTGQPALSSDTPLLKARWGSLASYLDLCPGCLEASGWVQNGSPPDRTMLLGWLDHGRGSFHLRAALMLFNLHLRHAKPSWLRPLMVQRLPKGQGGCGVAPLIPQAWITAELKGLTPNKYALGVSMCQNYLSPNTKTLWDLDMFRIALEVLKEPPEQAYADLARLATGWEAPERLWNAHVKTR